MVVPLEAPIRGAGGGFPDRPPHIIMELTKEGGHTMRNYCIASMLFLFLFLTQGSIVLADGRITVNSGVPGEVYLDGIKHATINPGEFYDIYLTTPDSHVLEVRDAKSKLVHREEIAVDPARNEHRMVHAFSEASPPVSTGKVTPTTSPSGKDVVTREELHSAMKQAKSEALAEEAGRRKRAQKREMTNKAITHVIAVETRRLPPGVKGMERIKLLGELIPGFGGR